VSSTRPDAPAASAAVRAQLSIERLLSRSALIAGAALLVAVALAWRWLLVSDMSLMPMATHGTGMAGMGAMAIQPWSAAYLGGAFAMWGIMMIAMMLPSAAPMILLHARIDKVPNPSRRLLHTLLFTLTYLFVWLLFSALAALAQAFLVDRGLVSAASLRLGEPMLLAALLAGAAFYQLSPAKAACLRQCQSPIHFVMRFWSPGVAGALRLGLVHGLYCVGCCWGMMLLLFVAGVMNLAWVALLAAAVFAEKLAPPGWHASKVIAALMLAGALYLVAMR
jgi:predicted metal-binding membrane protein